MKSGEFFQSSKSLILNSFVRDLIINWYKNNEMAIYFKGSDINALDSKSRVAFPAKMRKQLSPADKSFIINRGIEKCIVCYPESTWMEHQKDLSGLKQYKEEERALISIVNEYMYDAEMDAQSRLLLTKELLTYAGIKDKVKIIGMIDHIELWAPEVHQEYKEELAKKYDYATAIQKVFEKGSNE